MKLTMVVVVVCQEVRATLWLLCRIEACVRGIKNNIIIRILQEAERGFARSKMVYTNFYW